MCKPDPPKPPKVVVRDPVADAEKAEAEAQSRANVELANRRKRLRHSSLFTTGQQGVRAAPGSAYAAYEGVSKSNSSLGGGP